MTTTATIPTEALVSFGANAQTEYQDAKAKATPAMQKVFNRREMIANACDYSFFGFNGLTNTLIYTKQQSTEKVAVMAFTGRSSKVAWQFTDTTDGISERLGAWLGRMIARTVEKTKAKAEFKEKVKSVDVQEQMPLGSVLYRTFGWDCTIVNFYQVVGYKGKSSVLLRRVGKRIVGDGCSKTDNDITPAVDCFLDDEIITKRVQYRNYTKDKITPYVTIHNDRASLLDKDENGNYRTLYETDMMYR